MARRFPSKSLALAGALAAGEAGDALAAEPAAPLLREPYAAMLLPSVTGVLWVPRAPGTDARLGAGAEILLFTWANDADRFGPGRGKVRFDVAGLWAPGESSEWTILYRGGASVSFEGRPDRRFLIPYFSAGVGGIHDRVLGGSAFLDPGGGLFLVYAKGFIVDAEASYLFAPAAPDRLSGVKSHLTVSFGWW